MADEWNERDLRPLINGVNDDIQEIARLQVAAVEQGRQMTREVFQEAMRRYLFDPVLRARADAAAQITDDMEAKVTDRETGRVLRYGGGVDDVMRDRMRLAAAVALVLAERDPATGAKPASAVDVRPIEEQIDRDVRDLAAVTAVPTWVVPDTDRLAERCPNCGAPKWLDAPCPECGH
jgi:hypothetical protein